MVYGKSWAQCPDVVSIQQGLDVAFMGAFYEALNKASQMELVLVSHDYISDPSNSHSAWSTTGIQ